MKWYPLLIIILLVVAGCGTRQSSAKEEPPTTTAPQNTVTLTDAEMGTAGISVGLAEKGLVSNYLKVNGLIDVPPQNIVSVSFPIGGYLVATRLIPGMKIRKGQPIAEMKDQAILQLQEDYLMARTRAGYLQKEYERQKLLNATKTSSDKVLEQTGSDYQTQRILVNSLREKLRMIGINPATLNENNIRRSVMIYAPINGYVSAVHVNIGRYVNPSDVLFELVNPNDLHLALKVFEKDLRYIKPGQRVKATLVNNPGKEYDAVVSLISRNLDEDRSAQVHCHLLNATDQLLPGMFANARIAVENREALTVPEEAVVRWGDGQYIFEEKGKGNFEMIPVKVGPANEGRTEIIATQGSLAQKPLILKNAYAALMKLQNKAE